MIRKSGLVILTTVVGWGAVRVLPTIDPVEFSLVGVEDSATYLVYRYEVINPSTSTQGVAALRLDVEASPGTPNAVLAATGYFYNSVPLTPMPVTPHAEVGPISPGDWGAFLIRTATLEWGGITGGINDNDSIAPGDTLSGLGIRSSFLPGIREVGAIPTWQSCCTTPWGTEATNPQRQLPEPEEFAVTSYSVGPQYAADEITIGLLQNQLTAVCDDPLWLDDSALCTEFGNLADSAAAELTSGDPQGAAMVLSALLDRVEIEQQEMHANAYWLLYHNIRQAYANIAAAGPGALTVVCSPASVERADEVVSCAPSAPIPPIGSAFFDVTGWRFIGGASSEFDVTPAGSPPDVWEGLMVVGGSVWVYGTLAGVEDSASATVAVTPRSWSPLPADSAVERDQHFLNPDDMPTVPLSQADLAHFHHQWPSGATFEQLMARRVVVEGGPNDSLAYFSEPFVQAYGPVFEINRDALTDTQNPWYLNHPNGGPGPTCRRSYLSTTVLTFFVNRMVDEGEAVTEHWPELNFHTTQEAIVSTSVDALLSAWAAALTEEVAVLDGVREALGPVVPPCTLLY